MANKKTAGLSKKELKELEDLERQGEIAVKKALAGRKKVVVGRVKSVVFIDEDQIRKLHKVAKKVL